MIILDCVITFVKAVWGGITVAACLVILGMGFGVVSALLGGYCRKHR